MSTGNKSTVITDVCTCTVGLLVHSKCVCVSVKVCILQCARMDWISKIRVHSGFKSPPDNLGYLDRQFYRTCSFVP